MNLSSKYKNYLEISPEIEAALLNHQPVVALESTIIAHGMPYPENVEVAKTCEQIVRKFGSIPATIALINGKIKVGLTEAELELIGKKGSEVIKASRRDLAYVLSQKLLGATTVSGTMLGASLLGIKIMATGGIGGVHRGAELTFDVSADLEELAKTEVAVVCAGIKAILDIPKTMEYLETKGVPVIGYQTKHLPFFYSAISHQLVDFELDTPKDVAEFLDVHWNLGLKGLLIANPIPSEYSMDPKVINQAIDKAIIEMDKLNLRGKETTPYLLKTVKDLTEGKSLEANIALVYHNCELASLIAKEFYHNNK